MKDCCDTPRQWILLLLLGALPLVSQAQPFTGAQIIADRADGASSVYAADIDGDGDHDVLSASSSDDTIALHENDGSGTFTEERIATNADGARAVFAADVNGDGHTDILAASQNDDIIAWYQNDGTTDPSFTEQIITRGARGARSVSATDVDGDGDTDVLSASAGDDTIAWYENDGNESFTKRTITANADGARDVHVADVDADGHVDVLSASRNDDTIALYRNDGTGTFTEVVVDSTANGATSVFAADVDGDGDMDIISSSEIDDTVAWYENDGTIDSTITKRVIDNFADGAQDVFAVDIDEDGDTDVFSALRNDDNVVWYENNDDASFDKQVVDFSANGVRSVVAADLDGDDDLDLVSASEFDNTIAWYESARIAPVVYVDPDATGRADGSSWVDAYTNLQDALPDSSGSVSSGATLAAEIWVASGTYNPDVGSGVTRGDRSASFVLRGAVRLFGGFGGTDGQGGGALETSRDQRNDDPETNGTVLSGDQGNAGFRGDDAFHVVTIDTRSGATLDGFTIRDGLASGSRPNNSGAGIWVQRGDLTVRNALITTNSASGSDGNGGGVLGRGTFENVIFRDNSANDSGGAINGAGTFTNIVFEGNTAGRGGGAVRGRGTFTDVTFENNSASDGGAMSGGRSELRNVVFRNNSAGFSGGGLSGSRNQLEGVLFERNSASIGGGMEGGGTLQNVMFDRNTANGSGGGLFARSELNIVASTFIQNSADGEGGGLYTEAGLQAVNLQFFGNEARRGGAVYNGSGGGTLANIVFSGNDADGNGGAFYNGQDSSPKLVNVTATNNRAGENGGTIYSTGSNSFPIITNSILWGNSSNQRGTGQEIFVDSGQPSVGASIIEGGVPAGAFEDGGVLNQDPLFVNATGPDGTAGTADDNLRVQSGSPAIDAGSNADLPADPFDLDADNDSTETLPLDLAGNARRQDVSGAGSDTGFVVDMGAYEASGSLPDERTLGDVDGDGGVSPNDASLTLRAFLELESLTPVERRAADYNEDDEVTPFDAALILQDFLGKGAAATQPLAASDVSGSIRLGELNVEGETATVPVVLSEGASGVRSVALDMSFDPSAATVTKVDSRVPSGWMADHNVREDGTLVIGFAGTSDLPSGTVAQIQLSLSGSASDVQPEGTYRLNASKETSFSAGHAAPSGFALRANYPNPFRTSTTIPYQLSEPAEVEIAIYDVLGRRIETLVSKAKDAGRYRVTWDGRDEAGGPVASGIYFYRIEAGGFTASRKMIVVR